LSGRAYFELWIFKEKRDRREKKTRSIAGILLLAALCLAPQEAGAWLDKTHVLIVLEALKLLRTTDESNSSSKYEEIYAPNFAARLLNGASDEDWVPVVLGNERSFRHYYDPDSTKELKGVKYYHYYYLWGVALGAAVKTPKTGYYEGTLRWAKLPASLTGNWHNWPGAILAYDYTVSSKEEAYYRLGHVGHLLGDMADPDHATNVPHPGSSFTLPDDLELMFGKPLQAKIDASSYSSEMKSALKLLVIQTYILLRNRFTGTYQVTSFERLIEDYIDFNLVAKYFTPEEVAQRIKPSHVALPPAPPISGENIRKYGKIDEYFDTMARTSKAALNSFGVTPPLLLNHLYDSLYNFLEREKRAIMKELVKSVEPVLRSEPIYAIPNLDTSDKAKENRYLRFAWGLIKQSVEMNAGLLELFYDIVNHPPYVQSISIVQEGDKGGRYYDEWSDAKDRRVIVWNAWEWPGAGETGYEVVSSRTRGTGGARESSFIPEDPARIRIVFGPNSDTDKCPIDPNSVLVSVGGEIVPGKMTDEMAWEGDFFPRELPEGQSEKELKVGISARDLRRHYPRSGLPDFGCELDSNPRTPAKSSHEPPYEWKGYEPGPDRNHSIIVKKAPETKPESREERPTPAGPWPSAPKSKPRPTFLVWINKCGPAPGGRIHVGSEEEFKTPKRCRQEWLFGTSDDYITKVQIGGPFETLDQAVNAACGMISEAFYQRVLGWGNIPYAKMGGVTYLIDETLEKSCIKKR